MYIKNYIKKSAEKPKSLTWGQMCKEEGVYKLSSTVLRGIRYFIVLKEAEREPTVLFLGQEVLETAESFCWQNEKFEKVNKTLCVEVCD